MSGDPVAQGAAFLDRAYPQWREAVDPTTLNMGDDCQCVWGQIAGRYVDVVAWLDPDAVTTYGDGAPGHRYVSVDADGSEAVRFMVDHGFVTAWSDPDEDDYDHLTMAWQTELGMA